MKSLIMEDWKLYTINTTAFALSLTQIEITLKIILLVLSIGYTIHKWLKLKNDDK